VKFAGWRPRLLEAMGIPPHHAAMAFLAAWQECEGGTAAFNPLNTTERVPGSTDYNSAGVQNFPDEISGLAATLLTIRLHPYAIIRHSLARRDLSAQQMVALCASSIRVWGTNPECIARQLR
jgi:hypothetical protein